MFGLKVALSLGNLFVKFYLKWPKMALMAIMVMAIFKSNMTMIGIPQKSSKN